MVKRVLAYLSSLRLTIFLLILISGASLLGTLIVQNKSPQEYLEIYGPTVSTLLWVTGAIDLYHSWYFQLLLGLLSLNLIVCSLDRLPRTWRRLRNEQKQFPAHLPEKSRFYDRREVPASLEPATAALTQTLQKKFSHFQSRSVEKDQLFFVARGSLSLLGPYFTHLSILVIITGALIGSFFGFKGWLPLFVGEVSDQVRNPTTGEKILLPFSIRCDDFQVEMYEASNQPKDYKSRLAVLQDGKEVMQKEIEVNHPLRYRGISFYQASYGSDPVVRLVAVKVADGATLGSDVALGQALSIAGTNLSYALVDYQSNLVGMGMDMGPTITVEKRQDDQTLQSFKLFQRFPNFDRERRDQYLLQFHSVSEKKWTGLQVAKDPGVPVIWAGCGLMMLGIYFSFFIFHRRIWVRLRPAGEGKLTLEIFGQTRKAEGMFEKQIKILGQTLAQEIKASPGRG